MAKVAYVVTEKQVDVDGVQYEVYHKRVKNRGRPKQFIKKGGKYKSLHS